MDGYVTGLEPGTDYPNPRSFEREKGRVVKLGPRHRQEVDLEFALWRGEDEVAQIAGRIEEIAGGRQGEVCGGLDPDLTPEG